MIRAILDAMGQVFDLRENLKTRALGVSDEEYLRRILRESRREIDEAFRAAAKNLTR